MGHGFDSRLAVPERVLAVWDQRRLTSGGYDGLADNRRSRSQATRTGVTIRMWTNELMQPPTTGAANGRMTSEPA